MNLYKAALIGCGTMGKRHMQTFNDCGVQFKFVADTAESANEILDKLHGIDFIVVASPASTHYSYVKNLILQKIPVLVEKPLATNFNEARELVNLAISKNTVLFVGHSERYNPAVTNFMQSNFENFCRINSLKKNSFLHFNFERTHGFCERCRDVKVQFDLMVHDFDLLYYFVCKISEYLNINVENLLNLKNVECSQITTDRIVAQFNFDNIVANFVADRNCKKDSRNVEIFVENSTLSKISIDLAAYRTQNPAYAIIKEHCNFLNCLNGTFDYKNNLRGACFAVKMASQLVIV